MAIAGDLLPNRPDRRRTGIGLDGEQAESAFAIAENWEHAVAFSSGVKAGPAAPIAWDSYQLSCQALGLRKISCHYDLHKLYLTIHLAG